MPSSLTSIPQESRVIEHMVHSAQEIVYNQSVIPSLGIFCKVVVWDCQDENKFNNIKKNYVEIKEGWDLIMILIFGV